MMIQCQHCGSQVRVTKSGTGGLLTAIVMLLVVGVGGIVVYRNIYSNASRDSANIGIRIGQIGESR